MDVMPVLTPPPIPKRPLTEREKRIDRAVWIAAWSRLPAKMDDASDVIAYLKHADLNKWFEADVRFEFKSTNIPVSAEEIMPAYMRD